MEGYLPGLCEIADRGEALRWCVRMGWSWDVIDTVFLDDAPSLEHMRRMVYAYGPDETRRRLERVSAAMRE